MTPNTMTPTARYFKACDILDAAREQGRAIRIERMEAIVEQLAEEARQAMRTPFTIADLFASFNKSLS